MSVGTSFDTIFLAQQHPLLRHLNNPQKYNTLHIGLAKMYECRRHVRDNELKIRLNDDEYDCVVAFSRFSRKQKATLGREWLLAGMKLYAEQHQSEEKKQA